MGIIRPFSPPTAEMASEDKSTQLPNPPHRLKLKRKVDVPPSIHTQMLRQSNKSIYYECNKISFWAAEQKKCFPRLTQEKVTTGGAVCGTVLFLPTERPLFKHLQFSLVQYNQKKKKPKPKSSNKKCCLLPRQLHRSRFYCNIYTLNIVYSPCSGTAMLKGILASAISALQSKFHWLRLPIQT